MLMEEMLHQLIGSSSHYLQALIDLKRYRILQSSTVLSFDETKVESSSTWRLWQAEGLKGKKIQSDYPQNQLSGTSWT